jgi:Tol biopolymer transport system component
VALRLIAGAGLAVLCAAGCGDDTTEPPTIAIVRVRTGAPPKEDIVTVRADGRGLRVVAGDSLRRGAVPGVLQAGGWSPDGRLLAFSAKEGGAGEPDLYVVDPSGRSQRRLTRLGDVIAPVWTADGRRVVFTRTRLRRHGLDGALWSVDAAGRGLSSVTPATGRRVEIVTGSSHTGDRLAITRRTCPTRALLCRKPRKAVYVGAADGSGQRLVAADASDAAFSPDGDRIAFVSERDRNGSLSYGETVTTAAELYVSDADGRHARRLTTTRDVNEANPSWSPDGTRIAFQRGRVIDNAQGTSVWQANADGSCARVILDDPRLDVWYSSPVWKPLPSGGPGPLDC